MSEYANFQVELSRSELIAAMRHDCVSFFGFYLGEELTLEVPDLHIDVWDELLHMVDQANQPGIIGSLRKLFAVPREHAKSTVAKLAVILILKYTPLAFVLYVSKTNGIAKNAIRDILMWLASDQERELHGPISQIKSSETESLWIFDISIRESADRPPRIKRVIFKALGAEQQIRGMLIMNRRPEIIIIDDIEDLDNTTPEQQPKLDEWFMGSLLKAFSSYSNIVIFIGNMIRKTTLLARLSRDPSWNPTVYGCLVKDRETGELKSLWPGKWSVEHHLSEYANYRRLGVGHVWEAEMMNLTQDDIFQISFQNAVRVPAPLPDQLECGALVLDPAFGEMAWHDDSAITVHVRIKGKTLPLVADSWKGKVTEEQMFDKMLEFSYKWGITTWAIETEAAQKLLIPLFELYMATRKIRRDVFVLLPIGTGKKAKPSRILAFKTSVAGGSYAIAEEHSHIIELLETYTPDSKAKDDLLDSCAHGLTLWQHYNEVVKQRGIQQIALTIYEEIMEQAAIQYGSAVSAF